MKRSVSKHQDPTISVNGFDLGVKRGFTIELYHEIFSGFSINLPQGLVTRTSIEYTFAMDEIYEYVYLNGTALQQSLMRVGKFYNLQKATEMLIKHFNSKGVEFSFGERSGLFTSHSGDVFLKSYVMFEIKDNDPIFKSVEIYSHGIKTNYRDDTDMGKSYHFSRNYESFILLYDYLNRKNMASFRQATAADYEEGTVLRNIEFKSMLRILRHVCRTEFTAVTEQGHEVSICSNYAHCFEVISKKGESNGVIGK